MLRVGEPFGKAGAKQLTLGKLGTGLLLLEVGNREGRSSITSEWGGSSLWPQLCLTLGDGLDWGDKPVGISHSPKKAQVLAEHQALSQL